MLISLIPVPLNLSVRKKIASLPEQNGTKISEVTLVAHGLSPAPLNPGKKPNTRTRKKVVVMARVFEETGGVDVSQPENVTSAIVPAEALPKKKSIGKKGQKRKTSKELVLVPSKGARVDPTTQTTQEAELAPIAQEIPSTTQTNQITQITQDGVLAEIAQDIPSTTQTTSQERGPSIPVIKYDFRAVGLGQVEEPAEGLTHAALQSMKTTNDLVSSVRELEQQLKLSQEKETALTQKVEESLSAYNQAMENSKKAQADANKAQQDLQTVQDQLTESQNKNAALEVKVTELEAEVATLREQEAQQGSVIKGVVRKLMQTVCFGALVIQLAKGAVKYGRHLALLKLMELNPLLKLKKKMLGWDPYIWARTTKLQQTVLKGEPEFKLLDVICESKRFLSAEEVSKLDIDYDQDLDKDCGEVPEDYVGEDDDLPLLVSETKDSSEEEDATSVTATPTSLEKIMVVPGHKEPVAENQDPIFTSIPATVQTGDLISPEITSTTPHTTLQNEQNSDTDSASASRNHTATTEESDFLQITGWPKSTNAIQLQALVKMKSRDAELWRERYYDQVVINKDLNSANQTPETFGIEPRDFSATNAPSQSESVIQKELAVTKSELSLARDELNRVRGDCQSFSQEITKLRHKVQQMHSRGEELGRVVSSLRIRLEALGHKDDIDTSEIDILTRDCEETEKDWGPDHPISKRKREFLARMLELALQVSKQETSQDKNPSDPHEGSASNTNKDSTSPAALVAYRKEIAMWKYEERKAKEAHRKLEEAHIQTRQQLHDYVSLNQLRGSLIVELLTHLNALGKEKGPNAATIIDDLAQEVEDLRTREGEHSSHYKYKATHLEQVITFAEEIAKTKTQEDAAKKAHMEAKKKATSQRNQAKSVRRKKN